MPKKACFLLKICPGWQLRCHDDEQVDEFGEDVGTGLGWRGAWAERTLEAGRFADTQRFLCSKVTQENALHSLITSQQWTTKANRN